MKYISEDMTNLLNNNREINLIIKSSAERKIKIEVEDIIFNQIIEEDEKVFLRFNISLKLIFQDGTSEIVNKEGLFQLINIGDKMVINHYRAINYPFEILD